MELEFDERGNIKLPISELKLRKKRKESMKKADENPEKVILEFYGMENNYNCTWKIILPDNIPKTVLIEIKKWADSNYNISSIWIEGIHSPFFIHIRGHKNRCALCHTFVNGLNTKLIKDYFTKILQKGTCRYKFYVKD